MSITDTSIIKLDSQTEHKKKQLVSELRSYVQNGYNLPATFIFNSDGDKYSNQHVSQMRYIENMLDQFFLDLNDYHFLRRKDILTKQYIENKKRRQKNLVKEQGETKLKEKTNLEFSFVGFREHEKTNYHVHGLIRIAAGSIIDDDFIKVANEIWKNLVPAGEIYIEKNKTHNDQKHRVNFGKKYAHIHDSIRFIKLEEVPEEEYTDYIVKESNIINPNRNGEFMMVGIANERRSCFDETYLVTQLYEAMIELGNVKDRKQFSEFYLGRHWDHFSMLLRNKRRISLGALQRLAQRFSYDIEHENNVLRQAKLEECLSSVRSELEVRLNQLARAVSEKSSSGGVVGTEVG
jgi:hypothetical protein